MIRTLIYNLKLLLYSNNIHVFILLDNNHGGVDRSLYVHETCATDTDNIKKVFEDVKVTVLKNVLTDILY